MWWTIWRSLYEAGNLPILQCLERGSEAVENRNSARNPASTGLLDKSGRKCWNRHMAGRVFVAGASVAVPAGLPLFEVLRDDLTQRLGVIKALRKHDEPTEALRSLAPETFMRCLYDGGLDLENWLTSTLEQGEPNAVHAVLAAALEDGDTVWTVNVDELIERAAGSQVVVTAYDEEFPNRDARLLKPHGTISRGQYLFRSDQVLAPLPATWSQRFIDDCKGSHVILIGYAGRDVDLRVALDDALRDAANVTWFELPKNRRALEESIPALARFEDPFVGTDIPAELSPHFLRWADGQRLTRAVTDEQRNTIAIMGDAPVAELQGDMRLARALLLEKLGYRNAARRLLLPLLLPTDKKRSAKALHELRSLEFYGGSLWTKPVLALTATRAARLLPASQRRSFDRLHVTVLSSHEGRHDKALRRAEKALEPDDPAILVARAKAERFAGNLDDALALARRSEALSRLSKPIDVDGVAHALYERSFSEIWSGDLDGANGTLRELYGGVDGLAGVRWVAWALWQRACLSIYADDADGAIVLLGRARTLFVSDGLQAGQVAVLTVQLDALRLQDSEVGFWDTYREVTGMRGTRGWTPFTAASVAGEQSEWLRCHGQPEKAVEVNDGIVHASRDYPVHMGLALLRMAELQRTSGVDNAATCRELKSLLDRHPMAYIKAHLVIAEFLAGRMSDAEAMETVLSVAPRLATATGKPPTTSKDYCLGKHPEAHELFLP